MLNVNELEKLLKDNEEWLMNRILEFAQHSGYTKYTSTLMEAWRVSIQGTSELIIKSAMTYKGSCFTIKCDHDYSNLEVHSFCMKEAKLHRARGVKPHIFLGLFKYYKRCYIELLDIQNIENDYKKELMSFVELCFDAVEIGIIEEWSRLNDKDAVNELQTASRIMTNEKNKYLTIFETIPDPIVLLDDNLDIVNMNYNAAKLFRGAIIPGSIYYGNKDEKGRLEFLEQELEDFIKGEGRKCYFEREIYTYEGIKHFEIKLTRVHDVSRKFEGVIAMFFDITDIKNIEKQLRNAKLEAEAANVAKTRFLANMSHEIRTPMNGILGMLQLLLMDELQEKQKRYIERAKTSADALLVIINDILDISRIELGIMKIDTEVFSLRQLLDELNEMFKEAAARKNLRLEFEANKRIHDLLEGDRGKLRQVFINLIGNAIKFTEEGFITIKSDVCKDDEEICRLKFTVSDTGIGIAASNMNKLFKSFNQLDDSITKKYGGTGLGLAISKNLVELMGGEIHADSELSMGSRFSFVIPLLKK
ncbi:MAG: sensor histidine kinase [Bacillota bacterium]